MAEPTRDEYVDTLKGVALNIAKQLVLKYIATQWPFLSAGVPGYLVGLVVEKVLTILIQQTEFQAFFLYIDMRVDKQGQEFSDAAHAWFNASPEDKSKYEQAYLDKFYQLASLTS